MAFSFSQAVAVALIVPLSVASATAQTGERNPTAGSPLAQSGALDASLSPECRTPIEKLYRPGDLKRVAALVKENRPLKVLALGASGGDLGSGPTSPTYLSRLEQELRKVFATSGVDMEARGIPGELTSEAPEYVENAVTETRPNLVIWKVGLHDALAKAEIEPFAASLRELINWLHAHEIDVVLIDPPYTAAIAGDDHYENMVGSIGEVALRTNTPLVLRFSAMQFLSQRKTEAASNQFLLHELGQRCVPEYVARAITLSINGSNLPPSGARSP